jgi:hypothetical protein
MRVTREAADAVALLRRCAADFDSVAAQSVSA